MRGGDPVVPKTQTALCRRDRGCYSERWPSPGVKFMLNDNMPPKLRIFKTFCSNIPQTIPLAMRHSISQTQLIPASLCAQSTLNLSTVKQSREKAVTKMWASSIPFDQWELRLHPPHYICIRSSHLIEESRLSEHLNGHLIEESQLSELNWRISIKWTHKTVTQLNNLN